MEPIRCALCHHTMDEHITPKEDHMRHKFVSRGYEHLYTASDVTRVSMKNLPLDSPENESELISVKLIFCPKCYDVVRLYDSKRYCRCRASWGTYKADGLHAAINSIAIPLGFDNRSFAEGLLSRNIHGPSRMFKAFVIGKSSNVEVKE